MKEIRKLTLWAFAVLLVSLFTVNNVSAVTSQLPPDGYNNPVWAPPYFPGVRYYYLPDLETYYDIESQEFVYLNDGQWNFSPECPFINTGFDLNNCFAIALDVNVYQPWMHHHYYISHYPRYYYRDYYDHSNIPFVRGFNENSKSAIFWNENERNHARHFDNEGMRTDRKFRYSAPDRQQQSNWNRNGNENSVRQQQPNRDNNAQNRQQPVPSSTPVRAKQATNYYGKDIGQPVRVEKQMRRQQDDHNNDNRR